MVIFIFCLLMMEQSTGLVKTKTELNVRTITHYMSFSSVLFTC
jgi:hypothetical protein